MEDPKTDFCLQLAPVVTTAEVALAGQVSPWPLEQRWWKPLYLAGVGMAAYAAYAYTNPKTRQFIPVTVLAYLASEIVSRTVASATSASILRKMKVRDIETEVYVYGEYLSLSLNTGIMAGAVVCEFMIHKGFKPAKTILALVVSAAIAGTLSGIFSVLTIDMNDQTKIIAEAGTGSRARAVAVAVAGAIAGAGAVAGAITGAIPIGVAGAIIGTKAIAGTGSLARILAGAEIGSLARILAGAGIGSLAGALTGALTGSITITLASTGALAGTGAGAQTQFGTGVLTEAGALAAGALTGALTGALFVWGNSKTVSNNLLIYVSAPLVAALTVAVINSFSNYAVYGDPLEEGLSETAWTQWKKFYAPLDYLSTLFH